MGVGTLYFIAIMLLIFAIKCKRGRSHIKEQMEIIDLDIRKRESKIKNLEMDALENGIRM